MSDTIHPATPIKHIGNYIVNTFYENQMAVTILSFTLGALVIALSYYFEIQNEVFLSILTEDSQTVSNLLSILYASIAIIMAISSSTQKLSSENNRWLKGMVRIIQQFRAPIISSMILMFVLYFSKGTFVMLEASEWAMWHKTVLAFIIISLTVHVVLSTLILSLNMISYIKAEISYSEEGEIKYVVIRSQQDFINAFDATLGRLRDTVSDTISIMDDVTSKLKDDGTLDVFPHSHPLIPILSSMTARMNRGNLDPIGIYGRVVDDSQGYVDGDRRIKMRLHNMVTELNDLADELETIKVDFEACARDMAGCSRVLVITQRLSESQLSGEKYNTKRNDLNNVTKSMVRVLTTMSSCMMKIDRCLDGATGER